MCFMNGHMSSESAQMVVRLSDVLPFVTIAFLRLSKVL